jgi:hypothetical protein
MIEPDVLNIEGHVKEGRTTVRVQNQHADEKEDESSPTTS